MSTCSKNILKCLSDGLGVFTNIPTTTTTTIDLICYLVDCKGNYIVDCECNNIVGCGCVTTSTTTTAVAPSTTSTTTTAQSGSTTTTSTTTAAPTTTSTSTTAVPVTCYLYTPCGGGVERAFTGGGLSSPSVYYQSICWEYTGGPVTAVPYGDLSSAGSYSTCITCQLNNTTTTTTTTTVAACVCYSIENPAENPGNPGAIIYPCGGVGPLEVTIPVGTTNYYCVVNGTVPTEQVPGSGLIITLCGQSCETNGDCTGCIESLL